MLDDNDHPDHNLKRSGDYGRGFASEHFHEIFEKYYHIFFCRIGTMKWTANGSHLWLITLTTKENGNPDKLITQITKVIFYFIYISFPICCAKILPYCWWLSMITTLFDLLFHLEPDSCKSNFLLICSPCLWLSFNDNSLASIHHKCLI